MRDTWQLAVVTNDIYTKEDHSASSPKRARWRLNASSVWKPAAARITAIREDASMNLAAVEALSEKFGNLDLIFVESGGVT